VTAEIDWLRFGLQRLAVDGAAVTCAVRSTASAVRREARRVSIARSPSLGDRSLVVVPTAALHALPWSTLPSLHGRPLAIAPSASAWHARASTTPPPGGVVLVAGPEVARAGAELDALQRLYPSAQRLEGDDAGAAAVLSALDGARLAHVAAHGNFRGDNPLFSSLRVGDGRDRV
jgi:CHAT domain-containing protein